MQKRKSPRAVFLGIAVLAALGTLFLLAEHVSAVESPEQFTAHQESGPNNVTFAWTVSPDDEDQTNGDWIYYIVVDGTETELSHTAVADRDGWLTATVAISNGAHQYKIRASDGFANADSCAINMEKLGTTTRMHHAQCGVTQFQPVPGVSAIVITGGTGSTNANVTITFNTSSDDPSADTGGEFRYDVNLCLMNNTIDACVNNRISRSGNNPDLYYPQTRVVWSEVGPVSSGDVAAIAVRAFDWKTGRLAEWSCTVHVDLTQVLDRDACGTVPLPPPFLTDDGPQMPFVDLAALEESTGMALEDLAMIFGGVVMVGFALLGGHLGGVQGFFIGGAAGAIAGTLFNLVPLWVMVLSFTLAAGVTVIKMFVGGGSSD